MFREIHKNGWLKRNNLPGDKKTNSNCKKNEKYWTVFCIHDDTIPFLEAYTEPRFTSAHSPLWIMPLQDTLHISHSLVSIENEYEFVITQLNNVVRFNTPSRDQMVEWVSILRVKLREMKILSPNENVYSKLPEPKGPLLSTRDPTSPLPAPPLNVAVINVPGIEVPSNSIIRDAIQNNNDSNIEESITNNIEILLSDTTENLPCSNITIIQVLADSSDKDSVNPAERRNSSEQVLNTGETSHGNEVSLVELATNSDYGVVFPCSSSASVNVNANSCKLNPTLSIPIGCESSPHYQVNVPQINRGRTEIDIVRPSRSIVTRRLATEQNQLSQRRSSSTSTMNERYSRQRNFLPTENIPHNNIKMTLREQQCQMLRREMNHPGGVRLQLRRKDCIGSIGWVDAFGAVWVSGWKQKEHPVLYNALHIGDQLISIGGSLIANASQANRVINSSKSLFIELVVRRVPFGKVFAIRRDFEGQCLGLIRDGNLATIIDVIPNSLAAKSGLPPKAKSIDGTNATFWELTEINNRPLNLFFKENEIKDRLNSVGCDVSILVQPHDLIVKVKKQLKLLKGYKDFILQ